MKKIVLSLFFLTLFSGVFAQSFSLFYPNGEIIPPGSTIQILGYPDDEVIQVFIHIKNNSSVAKSVKVKKVISPGDTLTGTVNYFCWGVCYPPNVYVSPFAQTIQPGQTNDQFYGDYSPNTIPGISKIKYVFFDAGNTNDTAAVMVHFNASPVSVNDDLISLVKFSDAYPNPASNLVNVDYSIPESVNKATITITNMLGSKVKEVTLDKNSGKAQVQVIDLVNGIYFYSLITDDRSIITRKFVVRR